MKMRMWFDVVKLAEEISIVACDIVDTLEGTTSDWQLDGRSLVESAEDVMAKVLKLQSRIEREVEKHGER